MTRNHGTTNTEAKAARNAAMKEASNKGEAAAAAIIRAGGTVDEAKAAMILSIRNAMRRYDEVHIA